MGVLARWVFWHLDVLNWGTFCFWVFCTHTLITLPTINGWKNRERKLKSLSQSPQMYTTKLMGWWKLCTLRFLSNFIEHFAKIPEMVYRKIVQKRFIKNLAYTNFVKEIYRNFENRRYCFLSKYDSLEFWKSFKLYFSLLYLRCQFSIYKYKVVISVCLSDHNSGTPYAICLKFWLGNSGEPRKVS